MATLRLDGIGNLKTDVFVSESDEYSGLTFLKFTRQIGDYDVHRCDEVFMTTSQLDLLGRFLIRQAAEIRQSQEYREVR